MSMSVAPTQAAMMPIFLLFTHRSYQSSGSESDFCEVEVDQSAAVVGASHVEHALSIVVVTEGSAVAMVIILVHDSHDVVGV